VPKADVVREAGYPRRASTVVRNETSFSKTSHVKQRRRYLVQRGTAIKEIGFEADVHVGD